MKEKTRKLLLVVNWAIIAYLTVTYLSLYFFSGYMHSSCPGKEDIYIEAGNCIVPHGVTDASSREDLEILSVLSYRTAYHRGGWTCNVGISNSDELDVSTPVTNLRLKRVGDELQVNGNPLSEGETYNKSSIFHWNPWVVGELELEYTGLAPRCHGDPKEEVIAITGKYRTYPDVTKGLLIWFIVYVVIWVPLYQPPWLRNLER